MKTYLVKGDGSMGLFACNNVNELFWLVDRHGTPYDFMYTEDVGRAGILIEYSIEEDEDGDIIEANYTLEPDHDIFSTVLEIRDKQWHTFKQSDMTG
jgi:hypothetical protein